MKTVTVLLFFGAFLALNEAAAVPDTVEQLEDPVPDVVPEAEGGNWAETAVLEPEEEETSPHAVNDLMMSRSFCPFGWSLFNNRCFRYFTTFLTWAQAEKHCLSMQGNLASIHSFREYNHIQGLISHSGGDNRETWIGGSDAEENFVWFWSDTSNFNFADWCSGQPNNDWGREHCVVMNHSARKCWNDEQCTVVRPYVCVIKL